MESRAAEAKLWEIMSAFYYSRGLYAAVQLGLPDLLKTGPRTASELASLAGCDTHACFRLLRALATIGVFEQEQDRFALTQLSNLLRSDVERSQRAKVLVMVGDWEAWGELPDIIRTGKKLFGGPARSSPYPEVKGTEADAGIFDEAMEAFYYDAPSPLLGCYEFTGTETVCDIGGGRGAQLATLLDAHPQMNGILFDLPETIENRARAYMASHGLASRCDCVGGDFFKSVPPGADLYLLRHVLHNWDDAKAINILTHVARVLPDHGKVVVVDWVIRPDDSRPFNTWWDLCMLAFSGGGERTPEQHARLFSCAGLRFTRYLPAKLDSAIIEGIKV